MIYTFYEQFIMSIYFIILGMFISIMFDLINTLFHKIKITNYICQFISWIGVTIICINSINKISYGYYPIYLILFFLVGYIIYNKFLSKRFIKIILKIKSYRKNIALALFPITLYNYIIRNIKKYISRRKKKYEENNTINIIGNDDSNNTRMCE